jgi:uncharacterized membrane protein
MKSALRVLFWILVAASLLANAVVLGLVLRFGGIRDALNGGGGGITDLPRAARLEYRQALSENRADLAERVASLGAARRAMFEAAAARPYDPARVEAAMARVREATAALQTEAQTLLLRAFDKAAELP